jgi:hypothetical protein
MWISGKHADPCRRERRSQSDEDDGGLGPVAMRFQWASEKLHWLSLRCIQSLRFIPFILIAPNDGFQVIAIFNIDKTPR